VEEGPAYREETVNKVHFSIREMQIICCRTARQHPAQESNCHRGERYQPTNQTNQASTNLYCLVTEAHRCEKLDQSFLRGDPGRDSNPRPLGLTSDAL